MTSSPRLGHCVGRLASLAIPAFCRELGTPPPAGLDAELAAITHALDEPGAYLAFTPADCCPDNHYLRGERVVPMMAKMKLT